MKRRIGGKNETQILQLFRTAEVPDETMAHLRSRLPELFAVRLAEEGALDLERTEYVERRGQYDALRILARLRGLKPPADLLLAVTDADLLRRTLIEAVHELGHLQGLGHCPDRRCVMHFSNCLLDTDRKQPDFCSRCEELRRSG
jgi:archaemetzincin